jgi:hypothetical protein
MHELERTYFHNVIWHDAEGRPGRRLREEADALRMRRIFPPRPPFDIWKVGIEAPYRLLETTYGVLYKNYEEKRDYPLANDFHYLAMEAKRRESWESKKDTWRKLRSRLSPIRRQLGLAATLCWTWRVLRTGKRFGLIPTLYWALSGYGERPRRAFWALAGIWAIFAILYMVWGGPQLRAFSATTLWQFGDYVIQLSQPTFMIFYMLEDPKQWQVFSGADIRQSTEHVWQALVYSLAALARLNPEPKPSAPGLFQFLVTIEGILGPLQIALLALAIRRKVMR